MRQTRIGVELGNFKGLLRAFEGKVLGLHILAKRRRSEGRQLVGKGGGTDPRA